MIYLFPTTEGPALLWAIVKLLSARNLHIDGVTVFIILPQYATTVNLDTKKPPKRQQLLHQKALKTKEDN